MSVGRWCARASRRRALLLGAALLLGGALCPRAPAAQRAQHERLLPGVAPAALAHRLADFGVLARALPHVEQWAVESEWGNYTSWRYEVAYACGARCAGRAAVAAHAEHDARLRLLAHTVRATDTRCTRLPLLPLLPSPWSLPWPQLCEETEIESVIEGAAGGEAGGARLRESARVRCSAAAALLARCPPAAAALAARRRLLDAPLHAR